jgi:hypothetical protein
MRSKKQKSRPNCKELLESKESWSVSWDDLKDDVAFQKIIIQLDKFKSIDESFHLYFVQEKLKDLFDSNLRNFLLT